MRQGSLIGWLEIFLWHIMSFLAFGSLHTAEIYNKPLPENMANCCNFSFILIFLDFVLCNHLGKLLFPWDKTIRLTSPSAPYALEKCPVPAICTYGRLASHIPESISDLQCSLLYMWFTLVISHHFTKVGGRGVPCSPFWNYVNS